MKTIILNEYTKSFNSTYRTRTLRNLLENNVGLIFSFPEFVEVKVLPCKLFNMTLNHEEFITVNGVNQRRLGVNNSLYKKWFNPGPPKFTDNTRYRRLSELWQDWRNMLGCKDTPSYRDADLVTDFLVGFIKYNQTERTFGQFTYKVVEGTEQYYY